MCLHESAVKLGDSPAMNVVTKLNRKFKKRSIDSKSVEDLGSYDSLLKDVITDSQQESWVFSTQRTRPHFTTLMR